MNKIVVEFVTSLLKDFVGMSTGDKINLGVQLFKLVPHMFDPKVKQLSEDDRITLQTLVANFTRNLP